MGAHRYQALQLLTGAICGNVSGAAYCVLHQLHITRTSL